ncbi:hypothetical protein HHK36_002123 [Tetracentron sinense]|uniref:Stigma-specific STIG1-like protein 1 n=1 Tax=Tetracentron sinense TaxID=13715 RepID=A0A835DVD9_TETSI|nr:hypothetical protein HHK36_002123 [Tetracentron sinense]
MKLIKLIFFILLIATALVVSVAATSNEEEEDNEGEILMEADQDDIIDSFDSHLPENEQFSSLRGVSHILVQKKPRHRLTCKKFPRICRAKGSPGPNCCKKKCVNVLTDHHNCGMCGKKCKYMEICCRGKCVNPSFNKRHCGGCNNRCNQGATALVVSVAATSNEEEEDNEGEILMEADQDDIIDSFDSHLPENEQFSSLRGIFFILAIVVMASAITLSATPTEERPLLEVEKDAIADTSDIPLLENEQPFSLRGTSRFLAQTPRVVMTCNKFPRVCRAKGSPGPDCCKKKCVNVTTDRSNCGMCGRKCKYSEMCCKGECVNPSFDKKHCGKCNSKCKKGSSCVYGMCSYA